MSYGQWLDEDIVVHHSISWSNLAVADVDAGGGKFAVLLLLGPVPSSCGCCTRLGGGGMTFARASLAAISGPFPLSSAVGGACPGWPSCWNYALEAIIKMLL